MLRGLGENPSVYFVHSYYVVPDDPGVVAAEADYPGPFAAMIWRENLLACQFHPEKSQRVGLAMYRNLRGALTGQSGFRDSCGGRRRRL